MSFQYHILHVLFDSYSNEVKKCSIPFWSICQTRRPLMSLEVKAALTYVTSCKQLVSQCVIDVQVTKEVNLCNNSNVISFQYCILHILADSYSNEVKA